jgi:hypothetical protein
VAVRITLERGLQSGVVAGIEGLAESPQATGAIWRYLLDIDWMARVTASLLPLDHPLLLLLAEPRRLGFELRDGVWVRLIDARAALSARSYRPQGSVVIEVADEFCPWNAGCWRVGCDGVDRTDDAPALRCDVSALGLPRRLYLDPARACVAGSGTGLGCGCACGRNLPGNERAVVSGDLLIGMGAQE